MDLIWIVQFLLGGFATVLWFLFRDLKQRAEKTQEEFSSYKVHIAEAYVSHPQLEKTIDALTRNIESVAQGVARIEDRLYKREQE